MDSKFRPLPTDEEEPKYQVYPSLERAEENLRYRQRLFGEFDKKSKSTETSSKKKTVKKVKKDEPKEEPAKQEKQPEVKKSVRATADVVTSESFNYPAAEPKAEAPKKEVKAPSAPITQKEKDEVRQLVVAAKAEETAEEVDVGESPTKARLKLIDKFMGLYRKGIKLTEKHLQYTKRFFYWHPEAIEPKYIRFLIPATVEVMGYQQAVKTANELAGVLEDTKYEKPLKEYASFLAKKAKTVKILEMRKSGMNNTQIGEKMGLSSAEVAILAENTEKFIFTDESVR